MDPMPPTKNVSEKLINLKHMKALADNGGKSNMYISDDLEYLKKIYTSEQLQKIWESVLPKPSDISNKIPIITGTNDATLIPDEIA